jgi:hypothetical protein
LICLWSLVLPALTAATGKAHAQDPHPDDVVHYRFSDEDLFGAQRRPGGELLYGRTRPAREPLIRPRLDFLNELYKAVEQL